jgi:predicted ATPase
MIDQLALKSFKCFDDIRLSFKKLTLLTGRNSTGKTSVIQSLLFLIQNAKCGLSEKWTLDGSFASIGNFRAALDDISGNEKFVIGMGKGEHTCQWTFTETEKDSPAVNVCPDDAKSCETWLKGLSATLVLHVPSERMESQRAYPVNPSGHDGLGRKGEYAPWLLHKHAEEQVPSGLCLPDSTTTLQRQTEAWFERFFPNTELEVRPIEETGLILLRFRSAGDNNWHLPANVGSGLPNILPIVVGGLLAARKNGVLIAVNPEAYLHPAAQSLMGLFLAMVAANGAQVVVESHSDHILNGIRLAVKKGELTADDTLVHYFNPREHQPRHETLRIDGNGTMSRWPKGFFDQMDDDLNELTALGD